ncbi:TaqI-like C-terminal specificity domain-containing protein [Gluconobacter vitians]|uniref:TaqI-like C-terminal specificity domain-containing protein n=1 Tax=Gluconobacter vitians TaxID=2728102 RepID=UPI001D177CB3|nr:TaqI-like C-terminal specificity domain-containing protein [Gluconobacter vitians]
MKPLVSGPETSRYLTPQTKTCLLFPYTVSEGRGTLIPASSMKALYPDAWRYLKEHEKELRAREDRKFDTNEWYQFGRSQNIGRQNVQKLLVAQTVRTMQVAADVEGTFYVNNVRVNSIVASKNVSIYALMAALNGKAAGFVFKRTAKPKDNGYFQANKQFISYLPIPNASPKDQEALARHAERLQSLHDERRKALISIAKYISTLRVRRRPVSWLFPDLPDLDTLIEGAPKRLKGADRTEWAKERFSRELETRYEALAGHLKPGVELAPELADGELRFLIDNIPVIQGIIPPPDQAPFLLAQWAIIANRISEPEKLSGKKIVNLLRSVSPDAEPHIKDNVIHLQKVVAGNETDIAALERQVNLLIYRLHKLTNNDIIMIESK